MILSGKKAATLQGVQLVDIHGTRYYDVAYAHTGEERVRAVRLGPEAIYHGPQPGDRVVVSYMMGVAVGVELADTAQS
jgi:hypothetical protein